MVGIGKSLYIYYAKRGNNNTLPNSLIIYKLAFCAFVK